MALASARRRSVAVMKPPAAMMRSNAPRSTTRSLITGNALDAPRLDVNDAPVRKWRSKS